MPIGRLSTTVWVEGAQAQEGTTQNCKENGIWLLPAPKNYTYMFITKRCLHLANVDVFRIVLHVFQQKYSV